jgi:hypothetical protein
MVPISRVLLGRLGREKKVMGKYKKCEIDRYQKGKIVCGWGSPGRWGCPYQEGGNVHIRKVGMSVSKRKDSLWLG